MILTNVNTESTEHILGLIDNRRRRRSGRHRGSFGCSICLFISQRVFGVLFWRGKKLRRLFLRSPRTKRTTTTHHRTITNKPQPTIIIITTNKTQTSTTATINCNQQRPHQQTTPQKLVMSFFQFEFFVSKLANLNLNQNQNRQTNKQTAYARSVAGLTPEVFHLLSFNNPFILLSINNNNRT